MVTKTYNALEGQLNVSATSTTTQTGVSETVAIVGGYDEQESDSTIFAGQSKKVTDPSNAEDEFGPSELARASQVVAANGVSDIYGVPVPETETTESISSGSSITLSNTPLFNPNLHPDHEIGVTDTDTASDLDVEITYTEDPLPSPDSDTAKVNPLSGEVEIDTSGNYDITYTYGEYDDAIGTAADLPVRYVITLTEAQSVKQTLVNELNDRATDFDYKRGVTGATPNIATEGIDTYEPVVRDWRLIEVAPAHGVGASGPVRTASAVGGYMASQPIGPDGSGLYDELAGLVGLRKPYRASQVKDFDGVTAITRNGVIGQAVTTSTVSQFQNIYATEIIDDVASDLFAQVQEYAGGPQDIPELETLLEIECQANARGSPPNLGFATDDNRRPYNVTASQDPNDRGVANVSVAIVPYPIAEQVNINLTVADGFVQFNETQVGDSNTSETQVGDSNTSDREIL